MHEKREVVFRKETFSFEAYYYRCPVTGMEFTTTELDDKSIGQVYAQYRMKYGIPSPEEIKATRLKYGLSAARMSRVLGLGINQYRLYEGGEMPSVSIGKMLKIIEDPASFRRLVTNSRNQYKKKEYDALLSKLRA